MYVNNKNMFYWGTFFISCQLSDHYCNQIILDLNNSNINILHFENLIIRHLNKRKSFSHYEENGEVLIKYFI